MPSIFSLVFPYLSEKARRRMPNDEKQEKNHIDVHVHIHDEPSGDSNNGNNHKEVLAAIQAGFTELRRLIMAESAEMTAFRARVGAALSNISADITRILGRATGLSAEDKAALEEVATSIEAVADVVPEDGGGSSEGGGTPV